MKLCKSQLFMAAISMFVIASCSEQQNEPKEQIKTGIEADILITNGTVFTGESVQGQLLDIAVCGQIICGIFPSDSSTIRAKKIIDATDKIVSPGFVDPHTHSLAELKSKDKNHNLNYLTQGVTTVVNGNDGGGPVDIKTMATQLEVNGIGTNVALFVGHGSLREQVMGRAERISTPQELTEMSTLLTSAMEAGALGSVP